MEKAVDENKVWRIVNNITNPRVERGWKLEDDGREIEKEEDIADTLN